MTMVACLYFNCHCYIDDVMSGIIIDQNNELKITRLACIHSLNILSLSMSNGLNSLLAKRQPWNALLTHEVFLELIAPNEAVNVL